MEAAGSSDTLPFIYKTTRTQTINHVTTATELPGSIKMKISNYYFNCCSTVHFDKYKLLLPTKALFIKT
jgi:hypothetical protein